MWPDHCVQGSLGAAFHEDLLVYGVGCCWRVVWQGVRAVGPTSCDLRSDTDVVVRKGKDARVDSYSGFGDKTDDKRFEKTELQDILQRNNIRHVRNPADSLQCVRGLHDHAAGLLGRAGH